jgi:ribosomal protein L29
MAIIRKKEIKSMPEKEREEKLKELKLELAKRYAPANKSGKIKAKEIKKAIARLLTFKVNTQKTK